VSETVRFAHAAALALVGWYLIVPPPGYNQPETHQAFLGGWAIEHSYHTAQACEEALAKMNTKFPPLSSGRKVRDFVGLCVASDDPRLKFPVGFEIHN
jgi:hypothetical protein